MKKQMTPFGISDEEWDRACRCANSHIHVEIARKHGLKSGAEIFIDALCGDISGELLSRALDFERRTFDEEAFHARCRQFLLEQEREATNLALRTARLPASHPRAWKRDETDHVLSHHRYQLPVGQGGFHVGTLKDLGSDEALWRASLAGDAIPSADFLYVYDCGSDPIKGVVEAIRSIVGRRPSRRLDMLFVSHFDRDHICGIPHLLNERIGLRVDTVVMPYLDDVDRIIAFARCADASSDRASEQFHQDLVIDPVGTMSRFGPRQIIMVMPSDEDDDTGFFELPTIDPPGSRPDGTPWKAVDPTGWRTASSSARQAHDGATVMQRLELNIAPGRHGGWLLKPHVKRAARQDREAFCAAVEVLLRWPRGSFHDKVRIKKERRRMVTEHRTAVSRAYAWTFGNKNETSLSLYSGPADPQKAGAVYRNMPEYRIARVGWLGTGDAGLKEAAAVRDFQAYYSDELDWVTAFMLPHHGSAHNYDPSIPVVDAELWVAAAQPTRSTWKHPAPEIVKAIKASGARFRKVGSRPETLLEEKMVVFWSE
jgi:hypothetical protein